MERHDDRAAKETGKLGELTAGKSAALTAEARVIRRAVDVLRRPVRGDEETQRQVGAIVSMMTAADIEGCTKR